MNEQQSFIDAMAKDPKDATSRLVYADWLEENGKPEAAARLRWWANLIPHLNAEDARYGWAHGLKRPDSLRTLPEWANTLLLGHAWRTVPRYPIYPMAGFDHVHNVQWPHEEHATLLGEPVDPKLKHPHWSWADRERGRHETEWIENYPSQLPAIAEYIEHNPPPGEPEKPAKLASISAPTAAAPSVLIKLPAPQPTQPAQTAPAPKAPSAAPAQSQSQSRGPVFILPQ